MALPSLTTGAIVAGIVTGFLAMAIAYWIMVGRKKNANSMTADVKGRHAVSASDDE